MTIEPHHWQWLLIYAGVAALLLMVLQRLPVIGRFVRLAFSAGLLAFMIFLVLQIAPYQPELSRLTGRLGVDLLDAQPQAVLQLPPAPDHSRWRQRTERADAHSIHTFTLCHRTRPVRLAGGGPGSPTI